MWVIGHVFLDPGPTVDLLVCRRDYKEATTKKLLIKMIAVILMYIVVFVVFL